MVENKSKTTTLKVEFLNHALSVCAMKASEKPINYGILNIRSANEVIKEASERPNPKKLWDTLWYEGEVCCLFADSNVGKSLYAVQIGEHIAQSGEQVLYFDFELSDKQFQLRYTDNENRVYQFSPNFYRVEISQDADFSGKFEDVIIESIEQSVIGTEAKVIIVDNLSYLCLNSEKADNASELMMRLIALKRNHGLSMLILAHTPKRPPTNPITQNDLSGSKKLMNFFDSAFAIGKSVKDEGLRYIKQIKVRNGDYVYNADNVIVAHIEQVNCFTRFVSQGCSAEREHLTEMADDDKANLVAKIKALQANGESIRSIASQLKLSKSKVSRFLQQ